MIVEKEIKYERQWELLLQEDPERKDRTEYYKSKSNSLEALKECVLNGNQEYPPPELLWIISRQYYYYLLNEGKVSLEEAFFGKPKQRQGVYAKKTRMPINSSANIFMIFDSYVNQSPELSHYEILEFMIEQKPETKWKNYFELSYLYSRFINEDLNFDSFIRSYRAWKNGK